jgi:microcystin-dependent protein
VYAAAVPNIFTAGTTAKSAEINANFQYLIDRITPVGTVVAFAGPTAPSGWLLCDGAAVSRSTYSALYSVIGSSHGYGDNASTFNIPDYRGRFLRGVDGTAGNDPDKTSRTIMNTGGNSGASSSMVGSVQGDALNNHSHSIPVYRTTFSGTQLNGSEFTLNSSFTYNPLNTSSGGGGNETRPKNAYVNWIIKY